MQLLKQREAARLPSLSNPLANLLGQQSAKRSRPLARQSAKALETTATKCECFCALGSDYLFICKYKSSYVRTLFDTLKQNWP